MGVRLPVNSLRNCKKTALTGAFLKRKIQEYEQLKQEIESLIQEVSLVEPSEAVEVEVAVVAKITQEYTSKVKTGGSVNE